MRPQTRKARVMAYIARYHAEHGYGPTHLEIRDEVGLASTSSVARWIDILEAEGRIRRTRGVTRSLVPIGATA